MLYDVTIIALQLGGTPQALAKLPSALASGSFRGEFLACWVSEIGTLNQILIIRGYPDFSALAKDRDAATMLADPFGINQVITGTRMETYAPFPFVEPLRPSPRSSFYEVRTYVLKPNGLGPTIEAFGKALPARIKLSPLLAAMHTLTGPTPRFMHIWPYRDLDERHRIRTRAVEEGIWPPPGGPDRVWSQQSDIYVPAEFSPL